jgi:hypothetical protein
MRDGALMGQNGRRRAPFGGLKRRVSSLVVLPCRTAWLQKGTVSYIRSPDKYGDEIHDMISRNACR